MPLIFSRYAPAPVLVGLGAFLSCLCIALGGLSAQPAAGQPAGPVVLTVEGVGDGPMHFDLAMLKALPHRSFTTHTIWTSGEQRFEGVLLRDFLDRIGVERGELVVRAANDYSIAIPISDATDPGPIIAYARNGAPMSLRDKGPLWLVYPYDADPAWRTEVVYSRSIWQLDHMTIAPEGASQ
ncbi:molybdopterin-dependent oxidoreductase [Acidimangrovimonas pyrenivorans]|uniref:Molybdopterin-dependent oxidoreductase n=1 Tax=Acidimangrovimonas pyrenivorans TaxID=2030798 RepID=A0ABV7ABN5_9RHOB